MCALIETSGTKAAFSKSGGCTSCPQLRMAPRHALWHCNRCFRVGKGGVSFSSRTSGHIVTLPRQLGRITRTFLKKRCTPEGTAEALFRVVQSWFPMGSRHLLSAVSQCNRVCRSDIQTAYCQVQVGNKVKSMWKWCTALCAISTRQNALC